MRIFKTLWVFSLFLLSLSLAKNLKLTIDEVENQTEGEEGFGETTTFRSEDGLDGKFIFPFKKWASPVTLWEKLKFPVVPNEEESLYLENFNTVETEEVIDINTYNLGLEEGLVEGTLSCRCGEPRERIVGSKAVPARINDIPWTAALVFKTTEPKQPFCGGTLINTRYIITAGHCVRSTDAEDIEIWLNDADVLLSNNNKTNPQRKIYDVEKIIKHPLYRGYSNDIALIKLKERVPLDSNEELFLINPVCLPVSDNNTFEQRTATVAGWGKTKAGGGVSPHLLKIDVPIWSNEECVKESKYKNTIKENMLCAGFKEGGADACQGDSGGPLIVYKNDDPTFPKRGVLVGVVSWGFGCAEPFAPGVYTRVSSFAKWILDNSNEDAEWCQVSLSPGKV